MTPPCSHLVVFDLQEFQVQPMSKRCAIARTVTMRTCLLCGVSYNRTAVLARLRSRILERLPPIQLKSPWSAAERGDDPW